MAKSNQPVVKRRVRKAAPTVRESIEQNRPIQKAGKTNGKSSKLNIKPHQMKLNIGEWPILKQLIAGLKLITPKYFVNAWRELRQVTWPSGRETRRLTLAVFIFAVVFGVMVSVVDKGLDEFFKKVVLK